MVKFLLPSEAFVRISDKSQKEYDMDLVGWLVTLVSTLGQIAVAGTFVTFERETFLGFPTAITAMFICYLAFVAGIFLIYRALSHKESTELLEG